MTEEKKWSTVPTLPCFQHITFDKKEIESWDKDLLKILDPNLPLHDAMVEQLPARFWLRKKVVRSSSNLSDKDRLDLYRCLLLHENFQENSFSKYIQDTPAFHEHLLFPKQTSANELKYPHHCINDKDYVTWEDIDTTQEKVLLFLRTSDGKLQCEPQCYDRSLLLQSLLSQTVMRWSGEEDSFCCIDTKAPALYFKLPFPDVWIDMDGFLNLLSPGHFFGRNPGLFELKQMGEDRVGSTQSRTDLVGAIHGRTVPVYTLLVLKPKEVDRMLGPQSLCEKLQGAWKKNKKRKQRGD